MSNQNRISVVSDLLSEAYDFLWSHGETNWIRGIKAALSEIQNEPSDEGFENARSIYKTMTDGGRGFSEYYIWIDDNDIRLKNNRKLDEIRGRLWDSFGE